MSHIDRYRAQRLMREVGLDALVLFGPEAFAYATGVSAGAAAMWRRAGGASALVPSDPTVPITAVVSDLSASSIRRQALSLDVREHRIWVDTVDLAGLPTERRGAAELIADGYRRQQSGADAGPRPTTFDFAAALQLLRQALTERGLIRARIGADWDFLPVQDYKTLLDMLPEVTWADGSHTLRRLRAIKTDREIFHLRYACELAEAGLRRMIDAISGGVSRQDLADAWRDGVAQADAAQGEARLSGSWEFISVGEDPWAAMATVSEGALIKADVGCLVEGYSSDGARTFVFGRPNPLAAELYEALYTVFHVGLERIRPGIRLADVHAAVSAAMRTAGYPGYRRGHFGHGLGASVGSEEWPFIAADSDVVVEPGMVLAFEVPFYARGLGALMIEDQLLVTETGISVMNTLPRNLVQLC